MELLLVDCGHGILSYGLLMELLLVDCGRGILSYGLLIELLLVDCGRGMLPYGLFTRIAFFVSPVSWIETSYTVSIKQYNHIMDLIFYTNFV